MLTNIKRYNTKEYNEDGRVKNSYDYFVKEVKYNDELIKKIFIVDIRNMPDKMINYIFNNFYKFQSLILSTDFYNQSKLAEQSKIAYSKNIDLVFLYDSKRKYDIDKNKILYDMDYALKHFMTEEELKLFLEKDYSSSNIDKETLIILRNSVLRLKKFNYINGSNTSGKTKLLSDISNNIKVPIFSMNDINLNLENYLFDKDNIKNYIYQLTGSYEIDKYSDYQKYIYRLAQILEFSREHNNMLLLDDLSWNRLDRRNTINLIDTLFDYSVNNEGIVITGCNQSQLIKKRVYKSNIIEL